MKAAICILSMLCLWPGSAATRVLPATAPTPWRVTDDAGQVLELAAPAQRIVSLAPGATAMLFAAGAGARVVGTANYSDEPAAARALARIGDAQGFDLERIVALRPDVVVAWGGGTNAASIELLRRRGLRVYRHEVSTLADMPRAIRKLGRLAGTEAYAQASAAALEQRIAALGAGVAGLADGARVPSVLLQVWDKPVYTVGGQQLLSDVLMRCGFRNAFGELAAAGPALAVEAVIARDPDVIVALAPSMATGQAWLDGWRAYPALRAVRARRLLVLVDQRFSRLGPEAVDAAAALCTALRRATAP